MPLPDLIMTEDFQQFITYLSLSDALIEQAKKEEIARVLALHVAHYQQRYGDVSIKESLEILRTENTYKGRQIYLFRIADNGRRY